MLHFGPGLAFVGVDLFVPLAQGFVSVGAFVGEVFCFWGRCFERLLLPRIGAVAIQARFLPMQQVGQLLAVVHVGRCHAGAMDQAAGTVHANVRLHAKVLPPSLFYSVSS